jgi:methylase of polypeptide subunit release factors
LNNFPDLNIEHPFEDVYAPSDDSFLIVDYFKESINDYYFDGLDIKNIKNILDMGTGTGVIALYLNEMKNRIATFSPNIYASDVLENAIECAKLNESLNNLDRSITFIHSDLFKSFPKSLKNSFNIMIFNPPYLPSLREFRTSEIKRDGDESWNGGEKGYELFLQFCSQAIPFIDTTQSFYIYYISSSASKFENILDIFAKLGFKNKTLKKKHVFFEDIILNRLEKV